MLTFNFERVKALFIREFFVGFLPAAKIVGIVTFAIFLANLVIAFFADDRSGNNNDVSGTIIKYGIMLLIGGVMYASVAFKEFSKLPSRAEYLAIPGSALEKVLVKWLFTNPIFILVFTTFFWIIASIFVPFIADFRGFEYVNEIWTSKVFWNLVGIYFIIHSIFFFGSIAFNKVPAVLTIVSLILIVLGLALMCAVFYRIVYADMFDGLFSFAEINGNMKFGNRYADPSEMWQIQFFIFAFKYLLAPVMWVASIFKLSEKQV